MTVVGEARLWVAGANWLFFFLLFHPKMPIAFPNAVQAKREKATIRLGLEVKFEEHSSLSLDSDLSLLTLFVAGGIWPSNVNSELQ